METVVRNVRDLDATQRSALERVVGHELCETQQVIVNVVNIDVAPAIGDADQVPEGVPDWWNIYEGLSEEAIEELDQAIRQRADLTRDIE
jgi:hypothetical protein